MRLSALAGCNRESPLEQPQFVADTGLRKGKAALVIVGRQIANMPDIVFEFQVHIISCTGPGFISISDVYS